ncbi:DEAD/DEAH box helicase [Gorillibacterium sp. CAU 1737]|uniref:DEAD/DEAH box helicase n=1 Tax=Gorillibacterium sp. CAU 1737 TaxID=3140362 RepID=UPI0032609244
MTTTVYAHKGTGGWQWRATLRLEGDMTYWLCSGQEGFALHGADRMMSWGQAIRLRDRLTQQWPLDAGMEGPEAVRSLLTNRRELTRIAIGAGIPPDLAHSLDVQLWNGTGKQPFREQLETLNNPNVQRLAAQLRGRSLFRDELLSLCAAIGIAAEGDRWLALVQAAERQGWLRIRSGVEEGSTERAAGAGIMKWGRRHAGSAELPMRKPISESGEKSQPSSRWRRIAERLGLPISGQAPRLRCRRCGAGEEELRVTYCPRCGGSCAYCERCLGMGRSRQCEPLFEGVAAGALLPRSAPFPLDGAEGWADRREISPVGAELPMSWKDANELARAWGLSPAQAEASRAALAFLRETSAGGGRASFRHQPGSPPEFLIWAVTGAGKTEMIFPLLQHERAAGRRVLVATPRRDVVLELLPRLRKAFPNERVIALYGGSEERWESAELVLATTHQLLRFCGAFDLVVIDEIDAFPYAGDPMLYHAALRALAPGGRRLFLSATPPRELERRARRGRLPHAKVPVRYHRHPLPVPWLAHTPPLAKWVRGRRVPRALGRLLARSLNRGALVFLFVPEIRWVEPLVELLARTYPDRTVEGTSSRDPLRADKVVAFRSRRVDLFVTTTILERGVTVPRSDVFVLDAHAAWFDEAALVQMAGRAGRSKDDPAGHVVFAAAAITRNQTGAVRQIRRMNRIARKEGYLIGSSARGRANGQSKPCEGEANHDSNDNGTEGP